MPRKLTDEERVRLEGLLKNDRRLYAVIMFASDNVGSVVQGYAYIEAYLERLLERNMKLAGTVRWYAIEITRRLEIARAFGEIDAPIASAIQVLAEIRNGVAHNPGFTVLETDVEKLRRAMEKVSPTAMAFVAAPSQEEYGLFLRMVGAHGVLLRNSILFLNWLLQSRLNQTEVDLTEMLELASDIFKRPMPQSGTFMSSTLPFDARGKRHNKPGVDGR